MKPMLLLFFLGMMGLVLTGRAIAVEVRGEYALRTAVTTVIFVCHEQHRITSCSRIQLTLFKKLPLLYDDICQYYITASLHLQELFMIFSIFGQNCRQNNRLNRQAFMCRTDFYENLSHLLIFFELFEIL